MSMTIITDHVYPPIPVRSNDWCAYFDELGADCSPHGWGATEQEAIDDLLERAEYEREEAAEAKRDAMRDDPFERWPDEV